MAKNHNILSNEKLKEIKLKNEAIRRRHEEVEADRRAAARQTRHDSLTCSDSSDDLMPAERDELVGKQAGRFPVAEVILHVFPILRNWIHNRQLPRSQGGVDGAMQLPARGRSIKVIPNSIRIDKMESRGRGCKQGAGRSRVGITPSSPSTLMYQADMFEDLPFPDISEPVYQQKPNPNDEEAQILKTISEIDFTKPPPGLLSSTEPRVENVPQKTNNVYSLLDLQRSLDLADSEHIQNDIMGDLNQQTIHCPFTSGELPSDYLCVQNSPQSTRMHDTVHQQLNTGNERMPVQNQSNQHNIEACEKRVFNLQDMTHNPYNEHGSVLKSHHFDSQQLLNVQDMTKPVSLLVQNKLKQHDFKQSINEDRSHIRQAFQVQNAKYAQRDPFNEIPQPKGEDSTGRQPFMYQDSKLVQRKSCNERISVHDRIKQKIFRTSEDRSEIRQPFVSQDIKQVPNNDQISDHDRLKQTAFRTSNETSEIRQAFVSQDMKYFQKNTCNERISAHDRIKQKIFGTSEDRSEISQPFVSQDIRHVQGDSCEERISAHDRIKQRIHKARENRPETNQPFAFQDLNQVENKFDASPHEVFNPKVQNSPSHQLKTNQTLDHQFFKPNPGFQHKENFFHSSQSNNFEGGLLQTVASSHTLPQYLQGSRAQPDMLPQDIARRSTFLTDVLQQSDSTQQSFNSGTNCPPQIEQTCRPVDKVNWQAVSVESANEQRQPRAIRGAGFGPVKIPISPGALEHNEPSTGDWQSIPNDESALNACRLNLAFQQYLQNPSNLGGLDWMPSASNTNMPPKNEFSMFGEKGNRVQLPQELQNQMTRSGLIQNFRGEEKSSTFSAEDLNEESKHFNLRLEQETASQGRNLGRIEEPSKFGAEDVKEKYKRLKVMPENEAAQVRHLRHAQDTEREEEFPMFGAEDVREKDKRLKLLQEKEVLGSGHPERLEMERGVSMFGAEDVREKDKRLKLLQEKEVLGSGHPERLEMVRGVSMFGAEDVREKDKRLKLLQEEAATSGHVETLQKERWDTMFGAEDVREKDKRLKLLQEKARGASMFVAEDVREKDIRLNIGQEETTRSQHNENLELDAEASLFGTEDLQEKDKRLNVGQMKEAVGLKLTHMEEGIIFVAEHVRENANSIRLLQEKEATHSQNISDRPTPTRSEKVFKSEDYFDREEEKEKGNTTQSVEQVEKNSESFKGADLPKTGFENEDDNSYESGEWETDEEEQES